MGRLCIVFVDVIPKGGTHPSTPSLTDTIILPAEAQFSAMMDEREGKACHHIPAILQWKWEGGFLRLRNHPLRHYLVPPSILLSPIGRKQHNRWIIKSTTFPLACSPAYRYL
jgi:hypothetical protein